MNDADLRQSPLQLGGSLHAPRKGGRTSGKGGIVVAGDHRDTPSIQGALVSGRRAARTVCRRLR